jgi:MFS family permease
MAIPAALTAITPGNSGNTKELIIPFAIFGTTVIAMLVMWALNTAAQKGLMYTVISSKEYNKMTSLVMFAGAVGYIVSSVLNSVLYKVASYLPFVASGAVLFITMILFALLLKEPKGLTAYNEDDAEVKKLGKNPIKALSKSIKMIEKGELKNIITVMSAKIFGIFGIMGIQTYASSYGVNYLGINESEVPLLVVVFFLGYLFMALSSGFIADKVGRGPVVKVGFFFAAFMGLGLMLTKNMLLVKGTFFIVGMGNGMLDVMITTMVADSITNKKHMGVAMSTVMSIGKLSTIVAVPIFGYILEKSGNQFGPVFPVMLIVPLIGFIVFLRLPKGFGEIREENKSQKSQTV